MSKKSQKQIEIEKEYKKEVNRLNRFIKQAENEMVSDKQLLMTLE